MALYERDGVTYCSDTGVFVGKSGRAVGSINKVNGYVTVHFSGKTVYAHRLAFYIVTGRWPDNDIDHINGNRQDNRWQNLREATRSQNLMNKRTKRNLPKNVYLHPSGRYRVKMKIDGITKHFGYYEDLEAASLAADRVRKKYHKEFAPSYGQ